MPQTTPERPSASASGTPPASAAPYDRVASPIDLFTSIASPTNMTENTTAVNERAPSQVESEDTEYSENSADDSSEMDIGTNGV